MKPLLVYLLFINALGFLLMLADKYKARKNLWRIPETILLWTAVLGGSIGTIIGMRLARHKTKHIKFYLGLPVIMAIQIIVFILICNTI